MHHRNPAAADPEPGLIHPTHSPSPSRRLSESGARRPSPRRLSADRERPIIRDGPASTPHSSSRPRSKSRPNMVTPEEYEALPPSIQKKYFSSVERLRIARESAVQKRKKQQPDKEQRLPTKPSIEAMRPRTAHSFKPSALSQPRKPLACPVRTEPDVDEEQALRFLALPDKVKRSHFTSEELVLLTESSERALGSRSQAFDDGYSTRSNHLDRNGSVASSHCCKSDGYLEDMEKDWFEMEAESTDSYEHSNATETDLELLKMYARRRQGSVCSSFSALPPIPASKELASPSDARQKSFSRKRAISLAPLPLPPPTLTPAVPPLPSQSTITNFSKPVQSPGPTPTGSPPATRYYKDSRARQKLREFLASPEKFDEALEFGFPSERAAVQRSTSVTSTNEPNLESDIDTLSITDSKDDEEEGPISRSPKTPSLVNDNFHSNTTPHSSLDSGVVLPFTPGKASFRSLSPDIAGREMTLRMTLTRPDLRAPEQELYAFQRKEVSGVEVADSDPLALSSLPVCDDHTGAHGAFAVSKTSKGGFKKVWKNLRGR